MENMNLINTSEMNGIKFLHSFAENNRKSESLNDQINSIKTIIAMLNNEVTLAELENQNMDTIYQKEQEFLAQRDQQLKENDKLITQDLKEQCQTLEQDHVVPNQTMVQKQQFILEGLTNNQKQVLADLDE